MSGRRVDLGRTALGEAEERAFGGTGAERPRSLVDLAERSAAVTTGEWWRQAGGPIVTIGGARSSARSSGARAVSGGGAGRHVEVALAVGQHDLATLAHELAHALAGVDHGHDALFLAALVDLTSVLIGSAGAEALSEALAHFALRPTARGWPRPWCAEGVGFRVVTGAAEVAGHHPSG
ncbi:MAG: hypothetical protein ACK5OX_13145 [Desertimonas sp.]